MQNTEATTTSLKPITSLGWEAKEYTQSFSPLQRYRKWIVDLLHFVPNVIKTPLEADVNVGAIPEKELKGNSQDLQVTIDQNSGFCFGVVYAIEMAEDILKEHGKLYCLGDIVHNDEEVKRLEQKGLVIINHNQLSTLRRVKVLIRAHGEPSSTYRVAMENELELIDASCPVVLKLQNRIKSAHDKSGSVMIYGKQGHAEVKGLLSQTNGEAIVIQNTQELDTLDVLPKRVDLFSQTTKSPDNFYALKTELEARGVEVKANDTICRQVSNRDGELKKFADKFDVIVFVAGSKSSNGKVLYGACKSVNPNTYYVSSISQIDASWFQHGDSIGVCGATSTPMWLMEDVKKELESL